MDNRESSLIECLRRRAVKARLDWPSLFKQASEIVVFGSRSIGVNRHTSDFDVLVVCNKTQRAKRAGLDLICIQQDALGTQQWLDSEIGGHISKYGLWLKGEGEWRQEISKSVAAEEQKTIRLAALARSLLKAWSRLHPVFQLQYRITIRRELQRLSLLRDSIPIPPTPLLDSAWRSRTLEHEALLSISESVSPDLRDFVRRNLVEIRSN